MAHRKIDVDAFDEDQFYEEDEPQTAADGTQISAAVQRNPSDVEAAVQARGAEVRSQLNKGNVSGAVLKALEDPPRGRDPVASKDANTKTVMDALMAAKSNDIPTIVKSLSPSQLDILMKYIYRGMASPELYNSAQLLVWHEKSFEIGGVGSIVRVMTDRRAV